MGRPRRAFIDLPDWAGLRGGGFLYAAEFTSGMVKIGRTKQPRTRMHALQVQVREKIVRVHLKRYQKRFNLCKLEGDALWRALNLAWRCGGGFAIGREFFHGITFEQAARVIDRRFLPSAATRQPVP